MFWKKFNSKEYLELLKRLQALELVTDSIAHRLDMARVEIKEVKRKKFKLSEEEEPQDEENNQEMDAATLQRNLLGFK